MDNEQVRAIVMSAVQNARYAAIIEEEEEALAAIVAELGAKLDRHMAYRAYQEGELTLQEYYRILNGAGPKCHPSCRAAGHPCLGDGDYQDVDR